MKKRLISMLSALTLIMSLAVTSVFAAEESTSSLITPASPQATFSFSLQRGADSSSSSAALKTDTTAAEVYPQSGTVSTNNKVAFRIRNQNREPATGLYERTNLNSFGMYYFEGYGVANYNYYLYANAPSTNLSEYVDIAGVWYP